MVIAQVILILLAAYGGVGALVGVPFVLRGVDRIDAGAVGGTWGFRVMILPGVVLLWPLVLRRWRSALEKATHQ